MNIEKYRNFMGYLWVQQEDQIFTIGINEEGIDEMGDIIQIDLPQENEEVEAEIICGTVETDDGPLDIYSPVSGKIVEVNNAVIEEPQILHEDPYEAWLIKIESDESLDSLDSNTEDSDEDLESIHGKSGRIRKGSKVRSEEEDEDDEAEDED